MLHPDAEAGTSFSDVYEGVVTELLTDPGLTPKQRDYVRQNAPKVKPLMESWWIGHGHEVAGSPDPRGKYRDVAILIAQELRKGPLNG